MLCPQCQDEKNKWLDAITDGSLAARLRTIQFAQIGNPDNKYSRSSRPGGKALDMAKTQIKFIESTCENNRLGA